MPPPAEPLVPPIMDSRCRQPLFQRLSPYVRVAAAARIAAYVDDDLDGSLLQ
jgi:hypothetical protein